MMSSTELVKSARSGSQRLTAKVLVGSSSLMRANKKENKNTFSLDFYPIVWYTYLMKITEKQINKFVEDNDMIALGGDMFEDAGGHVWHEANIIDEIERSQPLNNLFDFDVAGALDALTIIK